MNRRLLEAPFAPSQIKQRKGPTGGVLDYVEGHTVIARLNQILDGAWSFAMPWHEIRETEVLDLGRLTAEGIVKTQFRRLDRDARPRDQGARVARPTSASAPASPGEILPTRPRHRS